MAFGVGPLFDQKSTVIGILQITLFPRITRFLRTTDVKLNIQTLLNIAKASFLFEVDFSGSIICSLHQFHIKKLEKKQSPLFCTL